MQRHVLSMPYRHLAFPEMQTGAAFDVPVWPFGMTGYATLYYDQTLGKQGKLLAKQLYSRLPHAITTCAADFGGVMSHFAVIIANLEGAHNGYGGAYHYGCDFRTGGTLYVDAAFDNPQRTLGLVVAELTECQMGQQNLGWNCGGSNGEALSRFLAESLSGGAFGALAPYTSGPAWDQAGRPNWIGTTEDTDTNYVSTGCGVVYLYWLKSLGFTVSQITQAAGVTLAQNYQRLTGKSPASAWADFSLACGRFTQIASDNPWG